MQTCIYLNGPGWLNNFMCYVRNFSLRYITLFEPISFFTFMHHPIVPDTWKIKVSNSLNIHSKLLRDNNQWSVVFTEDWNRKVGQELQRRTCMMWQRVSPRWSYTIMHTVFLYKTDLRFGRKRGFYPRWPLRCKADLMRDLKNETRNASGRDTYVAFTRHVSRDVTRP